METSRMNTIMGMAMATVNKRAVYQRSDFENDEEWEMYQYDVIEMDAMQKSGKKVIWMPE